MDGFTDYGLFLQVNRTFRNVINASPVLKHKIELFVVGLEYNATAGISLPDRREALLRYSRGLDSLRPFEQKVLGNFLPPQFIRASNGVFGLAGDSLELFVPGSASRRIPQKKWEIPLPVVRVEAYDFYPNADILAVVELKGEPCVFLLLEVSSRTNSSVATIHRLRSI